MAVSEQQRLSYISAQAADARLAVELQTEEMTLNLGPQHPATHGTLRIVAKLDGEQVVKADVICGYMHRGYEKLVEVRTYPQITTLVNRIDNSGSPVTLSSAGPIYEVLVKKPDASSVDFPYV